jgi:hypothetical protein
MDYKLTGLCRRSFLLAINKGKKTKLIYVYTYEEKTQASMCIDPLRGAPQPHLAALEAPEPVALGMGGLQLVPRVTEPGFH